MSTQKKSDITFFILLAILVLATGLNAILPQGQTANMFPPSSIPAWQLALAGAGIVAVVYGILGLLGMVLWRKLGFREIWDASVNNRQRFLVPALAGGLVGLLMILLDLIFSRLNGIGRIMHPPFPTSLVASLSAGIGEEILFRLFFISLWTWLAGRVILRGRRMEAVYWIISAFSAIVFTASHLPTLIILTGVSSPAALPPLLLVELFLMNGSISIVAAYYFKKNGLLAPMGIHFWADIVWHVIWGLMA